MHCFLCRPSIFANPRNSFFLLLAAVLMLSFDSFSQPSNDDVCDALEVIVDGSAELVASQGATVQTGEEVIVPLHEPSCNEPGFWCDGITTGQPASLDNSLWFKFISPASGAVNISLCGSNYDTQLAIYEVGNCSDFSSFSLIWATEDEVGCGVNGLSSTLDVSCLIPGGTYFVLIDGWLGSGNSSSHMASIVISSSPAAMTVSIDAADVINPSCIGGSNGSIDLSVSGTFPYIFNWSNGDTTEDISNLSAGSYSVTVTDYCSTTDQETYTLVDPISNPPLTNSIPLLTHPSNCGSKQFPGQVLVQIDSGTPPFSFAWSNGNDAGFAGMLENGTYYLTISDVCGNTKIDTFNIGVTAGPDRYICGDTVQLGCDPNIPGGQIETLSYNTDQSITTSAATCAALGFEAQNSYFRAFDLDADFGLTGAVDIAGFEVFLECTAGPGFMQAQPVEFALHTASELNLNVATLNEIQRLSYLMPDLSDSTSFVAPVSGSFSATDIVVVEVSIPGPSSDEHNFELGANNTSTSQPTYLTSTDCGINAPVTLANLGFSMETVMNLLIDEGSGQMAYSWTDSLGVLSDPNIANPTCSGSGTFILTAYDSICSNSILDTVIVSECNYTWNGAVSSDWNNAANWNSNVVPGISQDVVIPSTGTDPTISGSQNFQIKSMLIMSNAKLTIEDGGVLTVNEREFTVDDNGILDVLQGGILHIL
jgi:hypothetical protein